MKSLKEWLFALVFVTLYSTATAQPTAHIWEMQELTFTAAANYKNPYTDVTLWVELTGPGFSKKVYGFWDGGKTFRVRVLATAPGTWSWKSSSNTGDPGLSGKAGTFTAIQWTDAEKKENPVRRGFLVPSQNNHALNYADGTPYFALGDTWYPLGSNRFKWYDDNTPRPIGPNAGFKDYVRYRKAQGYNWINLIAAYPNWKDDDSTWHMLVNDSAKTILRSAWVEYGSGSAKNMDNEGGRPFLFPGKVPGYEQFFPDMDRINPAYFTYLDRKIAYLNANGFIPFLEAVRRDMGPLWLKHYKWPDSFSRFIQYIYSRYQAYNTVLSPVHLDIIRESLTPEDFLTGITDVEKKYGPLPFGNLLSANAHPSTLENWGEDSWITLHQTGNMREHNNYWYLTEIFNLKNPKPALNGEPYYAGYKDARGGGGGQNYTFGADGGSSRDDAFARSGMYGSFLSGGFAGHIYGAEGIWGADIERAAPIKMWEAFQWKSGAQMQYLRNFAFSIGKRYQDLVPLADLVSPNKTHNITSYEGWAYCARTPDKNIFLAYFETDAPKAQIRGAHLNSYYSAQWFNPRNGTWMNVDSGKLPSNNTGIITLPELPDHTDWGLKLIYMGPHDLDRILPNKVVVMQSKFKTKLKVLAFYGILAVLIILLIARLRKL